MKQAEKKCRRQKCGGGGVRGFVPVVPARWQYGSGQGSASILVTVSQVVDAILKIEERHPEWKTPLAVSQVLLMRLEAMREEIRKRAGTLAVALATENHDRARREADAINQLVCTWSGVEAPGGAIHGIRVTHDRAIYGIEEV